MGGRGMTEAQAAIHRVEDAILQVMEDNYDQYFGRECFAFPLNYLSRKTGMHRDVVRGLCRSLTDQGLCFYMRGLWTEDGIMAGAGYGITGQGAARIAALAAHEEAK